METIGDGDQLGYDEELPSPRNRVASTESLAVGSLALAVCSYFAGGVFQILGFVLFSSLQSETGQYLLLAAPTAALSGLAVALGVTATRREDAGRWAAGVAGGGVIVGAVGLVVTVVGMVLALTLGDSGEQVF